MRTKNTLLLLFIFTSSFAQKNEAKLSSNELIFPVITSNSKTELYEGDIETIKANVEKRKQFIAQIVSQLNEQKNTNTHKIETTETLFEKDKNQEILDNLVNQETKKTLLIQKEKQEEIKEAIKSIKDIHYKHVNLLQEIDKSEKPLNTLQLEEPYSIESLKRINDFIEEFQQQKANLHSLTDKSEKRLNNLAKILNDSIVDYTIVLSKKPISQSVYSLIRDIYLYQAEYAILKLKSTKYKHQLELVIEQIKLKEKSFPTIVKNIQIDDSSLQALDDNVKTAEEKLNNLIKEHKKLNSNFDKISLKSELELDSLERKIKNTNDSAEINLLQLKKQLNLNKVQYSYFIKNLLQQKEQELHVKLLTNKFQFAWVSAYANRKNRPSKFQDAIKSWQKKLTEQLKLIDKNKNLSDSLGRSTLEISRLHQQFSDNKDLSKTQVKQQDLLNKQLEQNLKTIQRLSLQINSNNTAIEISQSKNNRVLSLLSQQLNKIELIGQWFGDKFKTQFDKVKSILYYPLASFGDKPFTLAIIVKVLLYIVLGFTFLRFLRKRLTPLLSKKTKLSEGAANSISTLLYYLGAFLVFLTALSAAGFNLGQMMIVFGALGVGIGFGLQNIANNFISGMILLIDRTLTVGDSLTLSDGTHGKVQKLAMRYTVIRTNGGYDIIVPNSELIANRVKSMTFDDNYLRIEIPFGVSYDANPEHVREVTLEVANNVKHTINRESQKSTVLFTGLGDNSLDFVLRVWVFIYDRYRPYAIKSDYYYKLFKAFKEDGIEIPYPQRDLHIRSVDKKVFDKIAAKKPIDNT